jgi:hypothetical protein
VLIFAGHAQHNCRTEERRYKFKPFSEPPTDLNDSLKAATYDEFRQRYGEFIEKYGGLYNPGFN